MLPLVRTRTLAIIEERLHLLSSAHGLDFIRQATQWKGIDQGYTAFHHYEDVNSTNIFARPQKVSVQSMDLTILIAKFPGRYSTSKTL